MKPKLIAPGLSAPDFELTDVTGKLVRLSDFRGRKPIVLAFLRGFM
jgi:peroxiredoxin